MKISCIYKISSKLNPERFYIGSAVNYKRRVWEHLAGFKKNKHINQKLQRHCNKYGIDDFIFEILEVVEIKGDILIREQYYLDLLKPWFNILKNARGGTGYKHTPEACKRISEARKGKKLSAEHIEKLRKSHTGIKWTEYARKKLMASKVGYRHSAEARANMTKAQTGRVQSAETKAKLSRINTGKKLSKETIAKIVLARKGKKMPPRSEEWKRKQSESQKKALTPERYAVIISQLTGRKQSAETVQKRMATRMANRLLKLSA